MQCDSYMRGRVVRGIPRANVPGRQQSPALPIDSRNDTLVPRCTRSTGIDGRHGYVVTGVGSTWQPIEAAQRPRLGRPNCLRPRIPTHTLIAPKGAAS